jgi:hypothetical protein
MDEKELFVSDAAYEAGVEPAAFWHAVCVFAGEGRTIVGWASPDAGFMLAPVEDGIPMAVALDGRPLPVDAELWQLDHF